MSRASTGDAAIHGSAGSEIIMTPKDGERLIETRQRLIISLMDVNSRQLRCDSARAGAEIDFARLERDAAALAKAASQPELDCGVGEKVTAITAELAAQRQRLALLEEQQAKLLAERDWLDTELAELHAGAADDHAGDDGPGIAGATGRNGSPRVGRA